MIGKNHKEDDIPNNLMILCIMISSILHMNRQRVINTIVYIRQLEDHFIWYIYTMIIEHTVW